MTALGVDDVACMGTAAGAVFGSTMVCALLVVALGAGAGKIELVVDCCGAVTGVSLACNCACW